MHMMVCKRQNWMTLVRTVPNETDMEQQQQAPPGGGVGDVQEEEESV
jgi:hypothetical protein